MAVKKHGHTSNNGNRDMITISYYLNNSKIYELQPSELIKWCKTFVALLANVTFPEDLAEQAIFYFHVEQVKEDLKKIVVEIEPSIRVQLLFNLLKQLYATISIATPNTCPAVTIILCLVETPVRNVAINLFLRQGGASNEDGGVSSTEHSISAEKEAFRLTALVTLCRWLCYWEGTPTLHEWIISFMKALQEAHKFDILLDVSIIVINDIFDALQHPSIRQVTIHVFLHILASTRNSLDTFDMISVHVPDVLESLASDASPESRSILQNLVEAFTALLDLHPTQLDKYINVVNCLDSHMKSHKKYIMDVPIWQRTIAQPSTSTRKSPKVGLLNLGNTCYMNSALQALFMTKQFSNGIIMSNHKFPLLCKLKSLFTHMMFSDIPCINPQDIFNFSKPVNFLNGTQQDTSEFICHLFDRLHEHESYALSLKSFKYKSGNEICGPSSLNSEMPNCSSSSDDLVVFNGDDACRRKRLSDDDDALEKSPNKRRCTEIGESSGSSSIPQTIVQKIFAGFTNTSTRCSQCNFISSKKDAFWDLQLAFPERKEGENYSIMQLLEYYCSPEKLTGDNQYHCPNCKSLQDAERSVSIESAPKNLIVVLKRFFYDPKRRLRAKLFHHVKLNKHITLYEGQNLRKYELYAVIVHSGVNLDNGHYYTIAKDMPQKWYTFNDSDVQECAEQRIYQLSGCSTPYIIFYKRLDINVEDIPQKSTEDRMGTAEATECNNSGASSSENDFNPSEENIPISFLPTYLMEQVKSANLLQALKQRVSRQNRPHGQYSNNASRYSSSDDDTPGSSD